MILCFQIKYSLTESSILCLKLYIAQCLEPVTVDSHNQSPMSVILQPGLVTPWGAQRFSKKYMDMDSLKNRANYLIFNFHLCNFLKSQPPKKVPPAKEFITIFLLYEESLNFLFITRGIQTFRELEKGTILNILNISKNE